MSLFTKTDSAYFWCSFRCAGTRYRRSTGETDRKQAQAAERRIRSEIERVAVKRPKGRAPTLCVLAGVDVERAVGEGCDESRQATLTHMWSHVIRHLGDVGIDSIDGDTLTRYVLARRADGVRGQTIRREMQCLGRALRLAHGRGWVLVVPPMPRIKSDAPSVANKGKWHPLEVVAAYLAALPQDARDEATVILLTGLRAAEAKRLRWQWVEPAPPELPTRHILRIPAEAAKTRRERVVGLPDVAHAILARRAELAGEEPLLPQSLERVGHKAATAATGRRITLRDLRHIHATVGTHLTGDAQGAQAALGHTNLATTQRYLSSTLTRTTSVAAAVAGAMAPAFEGVSPGVDSEGLATVKRPLDSQVLGARSSFGQSIGLLSHPPPDDTDQNPVKSSENDECTHSAVAPKERHLTAFGHCGRPLVPPLPRALDRALRRIIVAGVAKGAALAADRPGTLAALVELAELVDVAAPLAATNGRRAAA